MATTRLLTKMTDGKTVVKKIDNSEITINRVTPFGVYESGIFRDRRCNGNTHISITPYKLN